MPARRALLDALTFIDDTAEVVFVLSELGRAGGIDNAARLTAYLRHPEPAIPGRGFGRAQSPHEDALSRPHEDALSRPHEDALSRPHEDALSRPHEDALSRPHEDALSRPHEDALGVVTALRAAVEDGDPYVRRRALLRWVQLEPDSAGAVVTRSIHDADAGVRRTACAALAGYPGAAGVTALLCAADDADESVRRAALRALPPDLRRRLASALRGDAATRRAALESVRAERRLVNRERPPNAR